MLIDAASGARRPAVPSAPELDSRDCDWPSIHVEQHRVGPLEISPSSPINHIFAIHLEGTCECEIADDGPFRRIRFQPGHVSFFPAGTLFASRTQNAGRFYTVSLTQQFVLSHTLSPDDATLPNLAPKRGILDNVVKALCDRIRDEVSAGHPQGRVYVESLAQALAGHMLRQYAAPSAGPRTAPGGLTPHQLRRAIEFMREHLAEDVSLIAVARAAGLSPFHFARRFKKATGHAPHQYLIRERIERARHLLANTESSLAAVAQQCGFCDQSHLTNHFRRVLGVTPRRYRDRLGV